MLKNCPHCGAANRERANDCYVCESPLPEWLPAEPEPLAEACDIAGDLARDILENIPEPVTTAPVYPDGRPADGRAARTASVTEFRPAVSSKAATAVADQPPAAPPPSEPEWKREVASKLEEYRSRRQRTGQDPQSALPFAEEGQPAAEPEPNPRASLRYAARSRPPSFEPVEIAAQPQLDFESPPPTPQPSARLVPVAQLRDRLHAGLLDAGFVIIAYGGFLLMFSYLGNELSFGKVEAAVYAITFFLIYGLYFTLFTAFGAATPGMLVQGLHVVSFDGTPPTQQQLLWRSFGYLVSAAAAPLSYLWALWDEDHLTWQDRISQTYLTESPRELFPVATQHSPHSSQSYKLF